jgi:hypothetical protein
MERAEIEKRLGDDGFIPCQKIRLTDGEHDPTPYTAKHGRR